MDLMDSQSEGISVPDSHTIHQQNPPFINKIGTRTHLGIHGVVLPIKKQRQTPGLTAEGVAYKAKVRESLDTQISEIKKYRETKLKPHRAQLEELEKEVKKMRSLKDRIKGEMVRMQKNVDSTKIYLKSIF